MFANFTGWHLIIVLVVVLLLFGAPKLPGLARSVGQSMRIFRSEVKTMKDENSDGTSADSSTPASTTTPTQSSTTAQTPTSPSTPPKL